MLPKEIISVLESYWKEKGLLSKISNIRSIGGGSINQAFLVETPNKSYFLKYNTALAHPNMFSSELKALELMAATNTIRIPKTYFAHKGQEYSFILMEYIAEKKYESDFWQTFANKLAAFHSHSSDLFGLDFHNYMGSLPQSNTKHSNFAEFFINERLEPQIKLASNNRYLTSKHLKQAEKLYHELPSIFPMEKPAFIHGDLWSGNFMSDEKGKPVIVDPAVYYGHREADIAMTTMFGGFPEDFYELYQEAYPMENGWQMRLPIYNLYPLLIHINLFGNSYLQPFERVLGQF